jgi:glyoxylase-like metal-dependent hydrolase (beta-lactamase superfamily II)
MNFEPVRLPAWNPGPMTGHGNSTYLIVGTGGRAALLDAGVGEPRHLAEVGRRLSERHARLDVVLVTHAHHDHAAGVRALAAAHVGAEFRKYPWPEEDGKYTVRWRAIDDGEVVDAGGEPLMALHTPGHSPDHLSFWHEPSATLFAGDLVVPDGSVMIQWSRGGDMGQYLTSLRRVLAVNPRRLLPAHGEEVTRPAELLSRYLEHRAERERQVVASLEAGRETVPAIAESIYDRIDPALMPAARENVRAHLEKLKAEGRVREDRGRWRP